MNFVVDLLERKGPLPKDVDIAAYRYLDSGHIDSLAIAGFIFSIEDRFEIEFLPEDTQSDEFRTVGGLINIINSKLKEKIE